MGREIYSEQLNSPAKLFLFEIAVIIGVSIATETVKKWARFRKLKKKWLGHEWNESIFHYVTTLSQS